MRGLGRLAVAYPASASRYPFLASSSNVFSTFSGAGGGGRGRGRGAGPPPPPVPLGKPQYELDRAVDDTASSPPPTPLGRPPYELDRADDDGAGSASSGLGHGQVQSPVFRSSWSSSVNPSTPPPTAASGRGRGSLPSSPPFSRPPSPPPAGGRGRGRGGAPSASPPDPDGPKKPIFFRREGYPPDQFLDHGDEVKASGGSPLPFGLSFGLPSGAVGRGKPSGPAAPPPTATQENRHLRPRSPPDQVPRRGSGRARPAISPPRMVGREDATKNAMDILSGGRGRGQTGRGLRGRGERGGMAWRGRGGRFGGRGRARDPDEYYGTGLFLGDNADGEKLAKRVGEENMAQLKEAFEEMSGHVLPSPMDDAHLEALHTNYSFEFEPEYHMEFNNNPDIDENPPPSLSEALEKMKPFLMQYEGIGSQEEWEEVVKETMERAPVWKELVDYYSGPDRVTAKEQHQELERVANTLPESVPSSVNRFTDRAILSLQSNPGWGFGKKYQFMDKLVWEMSQNRK